MAKKPEVTTDVSVDTILQKQLFEAIATLDFTQGPKGVEHNIAQIFAALESGKARLDIPYSRAELGFIGGGQK